MAKLDEITSRVSQRGSVVVPKTVRQILHIKDGDVLVWSFEFPSKDKVVVRKKHGN